MGMDKDMGVKAALLIAERSLGVELVWSGLLSK